MSGPRDTVPEAAAIRVTTESADDLRAEYHEQRIGKLEARADVNDARWQRLAGVDETNGRLGRMDRALDGERGERVAGDVAVRVAFNAAVAELRADVGTAKERKEEREAAALVTGAAKRGKKWIAAAVALVLGGGGYGVHVYESHDAALAAAARLRQRIDNHDTDIGRLYQFCGAPHPDPSRNP